MKKLLVILAVMLLTVTTFAQVPALKTVRKGSPIQIGNQPAQTMNQQKNADASFWFEYTSALETMWGEELQVYSYPLQCDFLGLFPYTDGNSHVPVMSLGQIYDWTYSCWNEFYNIEAYEDVTVPYLAESNSYSIDSIQLCYSYKRGTNVAASVVDTIAISYIMNIDNEPIHTATAIADGSAAFSMLYIPYNEATYMADYAAPDASVTLTSTANIVYDKIPLTADDATDSTFYYYVTIPAPAGLTGITGKKMAVTFTFIPGNERTAASVIGTDLNKFLTIMSDDPRTSYTNFGSTELLTDLNTSLFTDSSNFDPAYGWYGIYEPNVFWPDNPHPYLGVKVTCNDCAIVNVKDMEEQNITVSPNPATNNIKVNLAGEGKANVQLFNLVGQLVYSETATTNTTINVADLHSGIYMLKVSQNGKVYTSKVVVK